MGYGLRITNNSNQVLIDSDISQMHFAGVYSPVSGVAGGTLQNHQGGTDNAGGNFPYQYLNANGSTIGHIYTYHITQADIGSKPPMCFLKPTSTGASAPYAGIIKSTFNAGIWKIDVLQSTQTTSGPDMYVFTTLDQLTLGSDSYGLRVMNGSGEVTFDSQNLPLRIGDSGDITTPTLAHTGSLGSNWLATLDVNCTPSSMSHSASSIPVDKQMYYVPSIAHCALQYSHSESDSGTHNWKKYAWARNDLYWAFYRSAFRILSTSVLQCSYAIFYRGHLARTASDSGFILGLDSLLGNIDAAVGSAGMVPYTNSSRNVGENQGVLISNSDWYN